MKSVSGVSGFSGVLRFVCLGSFYFKVFGNVIFYVLYIGNSFINIEKFEYLVIFVVYMLIFRIIESKFSKRD